MIVPLILYVVTCGNDRRFIKFMTTDYKEARAAKCTVNRPTTIYSFDGNTVRRIGK